MVYGVKLSSNWKSVFINSGVIYFSSKMEAFHIYWCQKKYLNAEV